MINNGALYPWPLDIMQYQCQYEPISASAGLRESDAAGSGHIFYLMTQKHIIAGLTLCAVKG
jgi:hypothetical protein